MDDEVFATLDAARSRALAGDSEPALDDPPRATKDFAGAGDPIEQYRLIAEAIPQIIWATRADGYNIYFNRRWYDYTALSPRESHGDGWTAAVHPDDVAPSLAIWRRSFETGQAFEIEYRLRRAADSTYRWHLGRALPQRDGEGRIHLWFGTCTDIHDQKRSREAASVLARVSVLLGRSVDFRANLADVARLMVGPVADWCAIDLLNPGGQIERVVVHHRDSAKVEIAEELHRRYPPRRDANQGLPAVLRTGKPELHASITPQVIQRSAVNEDHAKMLRSLGLHSAIIAPILVRESVRGAMTLVLAETHRRYDAIDLSLAEDVASRCAMAIDHAELFAEARDAERRLSRQLALTRGITDSLALGLYAVDRQGRATFVNPAAEQLLGYAPGALLGRDMHEVIHFQHADHSAYPRESCPLLSVIRTGRVVSVEDDVFTDSAGGLIPVAYKSAAVLEEGQPVGAVVTFENIAARQAQQAALIESDRRLREAMADLERRVLDRTAELRETNARLELSNRELQDFASVASHDLQEPLRKIQAFGDRLQGHCGAQLGAQGQDYLARMKNAASRMQTLISDLLSFARITTRAQPFGPVSLASVAADVASDLESAIERAGARVEIGDMPEIDADPTQMRQLLQNLIGNALKFRKPDVAPLVQVSAVLVEANEQPGESIGVSTPQPPESHQATTSAPSPGPSEEGWGEGTSDSNDERLSPNPHAEHHERERPTLVPEGDALVQIRVRDNGIGFDEKYLDRIFNVFQRLHGRAEYEGTGIGLAVCRKIAERHGGTITAQSAPGEGATFIVTLPRRHSRT